MPVPCSNDFSLAATRYFDALEDGDLPLCFLFSGTVFHQGAGGQLQIAQIGWDREAIFRLPAATWKDLMHLYYGNSVWLPLEREVFQRLLQFRSGQGLGTWNETLQRLLTQTEEIVHP
jgi:hypothetical protein